MPKAVWNGVVVAESSDTKMVEGNFYFPPDSVRWEYFQKTDKNTVCSWKGIASYYTLQHGGDTAANAAWQYEAPKDSAMPIKDHIAFYGVVKIER